VIGLVAMVVALVAEDATPLRAAPREGAPVQAQLYRGDWLEVRGEEPGWLKVWDHRRERPGYVRPERVRPFDATAAAAPALKAVVEFLRDAPGFESLGIGAAALVLRCDPQADVQAAIGAMAERLARRASLPKNPAPVLAAHREVAESYGVRFIDLQQQGRVRVCYDGAAFRQVLASAGAAPADRARAALWLTDDACVDREAGPLAMKAWNEWRLDVLAQIDAAPSRLLSLVRLRRAEVLSALAFQSARENDAGAGKQGDRAAVRADAAAQELALADPGDLAQEDLPLRAQAALRVAAVRWAAEPPAMQSEKRPHLVFRTGHPGETCVGAIAAGTLQIERCTYGVVWRSSAQGRGLSLTVAVQPADGWTELWVVRRAAGKWRIDAIPPGSDASGPGYVELAGFSPDGTKLLLARESAAQGKLRQRFEVRRASDLRPLSSRAFPSAAFDRWADASWRGRTLALR
jgi:hypothetical protein